ncbi:MAG: hypothetical protein NTV98_05880 [Candidatus Roizmanbacteria bacterium]|nr:hypothetical protein [Candidatus Roizmanbacteria bacterium]
MKQDNSIEILKNHASALLTTSLPYLEVIFSGLLVKYPGFQLAIQESIGLFGYYMALKQEEVNSFVQDLMKHPEVYRKEIIESKEFRDGFVIAFEHYLKARTEEKKQFIKNVLLGFAQSTDKKKFELERLQDIILRISPGGLEVLIFIKKDILPIMKENFDKELANYKNTIIEDDERLSEITWQRQSISETVMKWINERYSANSQQLKKQYKIGSEHNPQLLAKIALIEHKITKEKTECWPELLGLGILRMNTSGGGMLGGGGGSSYHLTDFGLRFLEYITTS